MCTVELRGASWLRRIKSQRAEAALPQFDLGKKVGRKIGLQRQRRAVVLVVVDAADFDGSLPRAALEGLFSNIEGYQVWLQCSPQYSSLIRILQICCSLARPSRMPFCRLSGKEHPTG